MKEYNEQFIQYSPKKVKDETKNLALYLTLHITLYIFLLFFLIFFAWYTVFITTHRFYAVYGISMKGTLNSQIEDLSLNADKQSYDAVYIDKFGKLSLNDIIVLEHSDEGVKKSAIKRLLAFEGDYITIAKTKNSAGEDCFALFRIENGTDLTNIKDENFKIDETNGENGYSIYSEAEWWATRDTSGFCDLTQNGFTHTYEPKFFRMFLANYGSDAYQYETKVSPEGLVYVRVPKGKVFYMGDNRAHSTDARERGFADRDQIVGRSEFIVKDFNFGNRILSVIKFYFQQVEEFFAR